MESPGEFSTVNGSTFDPSSFDEEGWAKLAELENAIAAVERGQVRVEEAIGRRASVFSLTDRIKDIITGTDEHEKLMDHLRFLRKKEGQLRKEKILFIQGEIFRMDQSRSVSGKSELTAVALEHAARSEQESYFSSPRASSAAAAAFATAAAAAATAESSIITPPSSPRQPSSRRVPPDGAGGRAKGIRSYFQGFTRIRGRTQARVRGRRASSARSYENKAGGGSRAPSVTFSAEEESVVSSYSRRNPLSERTSPLSGESSWFAGSSDGKDAGRNGPGRDCYAGERDGGLKRRFAWGQSWRRAKANKNDKHGLETCAGGERRSASSPPQGRMMMRGSSQRSMRSAASLAAHRSRCDEGLVPNMSPPPRRRSASADCFRIYHVDKKKDLSELDLSLKLERRTVRFEISPSHSGSFSPLVSPSARRETSEEVRRSAASLAERRGDGSLTRVPGNTGSAATGRKQLLRRFPSDDSSMQLVTPLSMRGASNSPWMTGGRRKLVRRASSDEGSFNAEAVLKNQCATLVERGKNGPETPAEVAAAAAAATALWVAGALSPTVATLRSAQTAGLVTTSARGLPRMVNSSSGPRHSNTNDSIRSSIDGRRRVSHSPRAPYVAPAEAATVGQSLALTKLHRPPRSAARIDLSKSTLVRMHKFLTNTFTVVDAGNVQRMGNGAATVSTGVDPAALPLIAPPPVWVTGYVDKPMYGLGFLLSDGSVGARFNDATKIVLEPSGVAFEYAERSRRRTSGIAAGERVEWGAGRREQPPRARHTLQEFPPRLHKKVKLLNYLRSDLQKLAQRQQQQGGGAEVAAGKNEALAETVGSPSALGLAKAGEDLPVIEQWQRTRNSCLFLLSNSTLQVLFSDTSEILLTHYARVVTYVSKSGKRETFSVDSMLLSDRKGVSKRVRHTKDMILQLLTRGKKNDVGSKGKDPVDVGQE